MNIEDYNIHDWNFLEYNFSRCLQKCAGRVNFTLDRWLSTKTFCVPYICLQLQLFSAQRFLRRWKCNFKTSIRRCKGKQGSSWRGNIIIKHHSFFWYIWFGLNTQIIDKPILLQEVICPKLQELLFFMHSFLTAKVASVDPAFMSVKSGYSTTNTVGQPSSLTRNSSSDAPNYESWRA